MGCDLNAINGNDGFVLYVQDAIREQKPAIASILKSHGGLLGSDPQLEESQARHAERRREALTSKQARREQKNVLFQKQTNVLERLLEVYHIMSEQLPLLCKYINLLT